MSRLDALFATTRAEHRAALVGYLPAGYPTVDESISLTNSCSRAVCSFA